MMKSLNRNSGIVAHRIPVSYGGEPVLFEIPLPCDAGVITGIEVLAEIGNGAWNALKTSQWPVYSAGQIALRHKQPGDIFFQSEVSWEKTFEVDYALLPGINHPGRIPATFPAFSVYGKSYQPFSMEIHPKSKTLSGFYKDSINTLTSLTENYQVSLYLYYQKRP